MLIFMGFASFSLWQLRFPQSQCSWPVSITKMGYASSKKTVTRAGSSTPEGPCMACLSSQRWSKNESGWNRKGVVTEAHEGEVREWRKGSLRRGTGSVSLRLSCRFVEAEQNAAGWPPWLTSVAGEAIQGWVPLKTDSFERLDKVPQQPHLPTC